jgi:predicted ArsR family transcriptional regulator
MSGGRDPGAVPVVASGSSLTDAEFTDAVEAVTSAFGDPTRRRIYLSVRERPEGVTASEIAERFALHANVARHHLDKLAAGGYVEVFVTRSAHNGAGRPSKRYRVSAQVPGVEPPRRSDDLLILLLGQALSQLPADQAEAMAERVGEDYGRGMAERVGAGRTDAVSTTSDTPSSFRNALHTVADALSAHGFAAHAEARAGSLALIQERCPFFDTARQHPVICAVDRGMVRGMLAGLYGQPVPASLASSRARGDEACVTVTAI